MKKETKKAPTIRFQGFTDDWEQRKLGECCQEFKSGSFIPASDIGDVGKYPVYGGNGLRGFSSEYNHDGEFALIGRQGALCGNMNYSVGRAYFTEHAIAVQANKTADTKFLYYLLKKMNLGQYSDQSAQPGLAVGKLVKLIELVPSVAEQIKIGHQFMGIDNLITLHQRKLDQLKTLKKYFLQNMFPAKGEKVPRIRFKGFTGDWEQRKLKDIAESYSGGTPSVGQKKYYEGNIPFIRSAEINSDSTELFLSEEGLKNSSAKTVAEGDILYALYGATSGEVGRSRLNGAINQAILAIQPHAEFDSEFIMQWLRKSKQPIISKYLQGGQGNLSGTIVTGLEIDLPTYSEQKRIGEYFQHIDTLITLHQQKLNQLQMMKKFMLQNLFI